MEKKKQLLILLLIAVLGVTMTGCTTYDNFKTAFFSSDKSDDTIKIGVLQPLSGVYKELGIQELEGIRLANKLYPKVNGKKVELIEADSQGSIYVAESVVKDLVNKKPTMVIGSHGDAVTLTAAKELEKAKIPGISASATNPLISENHDYYAQVSFTDADQSKAIARFMREELEVTKAAVVRTEGDTQCSEMARSFKKAFTADLGEEAEGSVKTVKLEIKEKNYDAYLKEIKKAGIKAVFAPVSVEEAGKLFASAEKLKMEDVTFIGPVSWDTKEMAKLQKKHSDVKVMMAADFGSKTDNDNDEYEKFVKAFKKEYGKEPTEINARAYDAYMIAMETLKNGTKKNGKLKDGEALMEELLAIEDFPAVTGNISFDKNGKAVKTIKIDELKDGKFTTVYTVEN